MTENHIKQQQKDHLIQFVGISALMGLVIGHELVVWIHAVNTQSQHGVVAWMISLSAGFMVIAAILTLHGSTSIEWELAHTPNTWPREPKQFREDIHSIGLSFIYIIMTLITTIILATCNYPSPQPSIVLWNMFSCVPLAICDLVVFMNYKDAIRELWEHERCSRHTEEVDEEVDEDK